jgi:hypothetical protein
MGVIFRSVTTLSGWLSSADLLYHVMINPDDPDLKLPSSECECLVLYLIRIRWSTPWSLTVRISPCELSDMRESDLTSNPSIPLDVGNLV